jgi:hypothetical protein
MSDKTITDVLVDMKNEVKWFRNAARKHALNANKTVIATTKIAELVSARDPHPDR